MSTTDNEIIRLTNARNTIRTKLVELKLANDTDKIDTLATTIDNISNQGAVQAQIKEGETFTIPKGYHNGAGTVRGIAGGGDYALQSKEGITPTKSQQEITPDTGYYGLSGVTINPIPSNYADISSVEVSRPDVLANKKFVDHNGNLTTGTMIDYSGTKGYTDFLSPYHDGRSKYLIPQGYHDGQNSYFTINLMDTVTVEPSREEQEIEPEISTVLSTVIIKPIPDEYIDTRDADADASQIYDGATAYVNGVKVTGTMEDHTGFSTKLDTQTTSVDLEEGYYSEASVYINLETKSVTPTTSTQTIVPTAGQVLSKVTVAAIPDTYVLESDIANELAKI